MTTGNEPQIGGSNHVTESSLEIAEATRLIANLMSIIHRPHWDQTSDIVSIKNQAS